MTIQTSTHATQKKKKNQNPYNQKLAPLIALDLKVEPNQ